ncbi:MAG TPA: HAD family hydrolase [Anaerolineales bacterium]
MKGKFQFVAFDADDTLWHTEPLYIQTQTEFTRLLSAYHSPEWIDQKLYQTEMRNLQLFGYGIKAFVLSMIETAIELTEGRIQGSEIQQIIDQGRKMLASEIRLLDGVSETVAALAQTHPLMLITKGDLIDQEVKLARSGLGDYFQSFEVTSDKTAPVYKAILTKHSIEPQRFLMVGNSLRSDILPVVELGAKAVYIPYALTWAHESGERPQPGLPGYYELDSIVNLPKLVEQIESA